MKMEEFIEKAQAIDEICIRDVFGNNVLFEIYAKSTYKKVEAHAKTVIEKVLPSIDDIYAIEYKDNIYVARKEEVHKAIKVIQEAESYTQMASKLNNLSATFQYHEVRSEAKDHKIQYIRLSWGNWASHCAMCCILHMIAKEHHIQVNMPYDFVLIIKKEECDDQERCQLFCKEQTKMRKMDRVFGLD